MASAPLPAPQYINYIDNLFLLVGMDKVAVNDIDSTAIPVAEANALIATGESIALEDLSPYYVTVPALITTTGGNWTTLPPQTYTFVYNMMVYQSALQLIGSFIARNTDNANGTLSYFQNYYTNEYGKLLARLQDKLPTGSYRYQLIGLQLLNTGIPRKPRTYSVGGNLGADNYTDTQVTNPARNFDVFWGSN